MQKLKGILLVALGAASYGLLATFVKKANIEGHPTSGLNFLQYLIGFIALASIALFAAKRKSNAVVLKNNTALDTTSKVHKKNGPLRLVLFGFASGLTSYFYYYSIQYIPVSVAIVLLMQAIWMGVVLELWMSKTFQLSKIIGSALVIIGTLFAVDAFHAESALNAQGLIYGILASISYTVSLYAANTVALQLPNMVRSKYIGLGALLIVVLIWNLQLIEVVDFGNAALWKYGLFLAFFGAILPPIAFNKGFPITGIGLGSILVSIEIPVSILSASLVLNEEVKGLQWMGVCIIIVSVIVINYQQLKAPKS
ncbi:EamA/RhaT family transporter [Putridiphycobacter roseus]|uniref:EamA/RhaT family transporter n=1 Tax=Putridiphycobacter roseus TaxID=2219161 RepID=A0A2W1N2L6_9FLAO|nr:DMT family transporter [Putridiphycobacter roseus]PZE18547.1 EamA/RhaT family transporter [Putridiphycobacter roseus]